MSIVTLHRPTVGSIIAFCTSWEMRRNEATSSNEND